MNGKTYRFVVSAFFITLTGLLPASALDGEAYVRVRPSLFAEYTEQARDESITPQKIWGDFDTLFLEGGGSVRVWKRLFTSLSAKGGLILPNKMFLGDEKSFLTIGGYLGGFEVGPTLRLIETDKTNLDIALEFSYTQGEKSFTDFEANGSIAKSGTFGSYAFRLFGPDISASLTTQPSAALPIMLRMQAFGSPHFENHNVVTGWEDAPKKEYAVGYRYGGNLSLGWRVSASLDICAGYNFERMYFNSATEVTHDLDILYHSPFLELCFRF